MIEPVWSSRMKTTLNLDDDLLRAAKAHAEARGVTLTSVVQDALRRLLTEPDVPQFRLHLPVTRGRRQPAVDIDSNAAVAEYLDRSEHDFTLS